MAGFDPQIAMLLCLVSVLVRVVTKSGMVDRIARVALPAFAAFILAGAAFGAFLACHVAG